MELDSFYESIARLKAKGVIPDAYSGSPDDPDGTVLSDFLEYVFEAYPQNRPDWLEAFYQVLTWQFETFHEGAEGYYSDIYGLSPRELQMKTARFLEENGYPEIAAPYRGGMDGTTAGIRKWMGENAETIWNFCLNLLEQHRPDWPEPEEGGTDD